MAKGRYEESSIRVLKGLQPVRERPGMYTRTTDPTHIIQEVIDNAADEALAGQATRIDVRVHADQSVSVEDDGRGIPVGPHPEEKVSTVEVVFTRLHAGGKFDKKDGQGAYAFSGGLHGVGVSVTNALSRRLEVEVKRDGKVHRMVFAGGEVAEKLKVIGTCGQRASGTTVRAYPDPKYFDSPTVSVADLERLLRAKAVLLPGVKVTLAVEKGKEWKTQTWSYPGGLTDYLRELGEGLEPVAPIFAGETYLGKPKDGDTFAEGEGAAWALAWYDEGAAAGESYVNLIPTPAGGTHEAGLRAALFEAVKAFVDHHGLLPRGARLQTEDVSARVHYVLSARILDPQFQGQVKEKLTSRDALKLIAQVVKDPLEVWLNSHVEFGKRIAELAIAAGADANEVGAEGREEEEAPAWPCCRASSPTANRTTCRDARCSWSKATPPAARRSSRATSSTRRSCRCAARCSTRSRSSATACSPTPRSTTSRWRSASTRIARRTRRISRGCVTPGSSSWPTPTSTAVTSRCCC